MRIENNLQKNIKQILSDIKYENGKWDTTLYFQDTNTPFDKPLYIFTDRGFVIERMNQINGFFDTAQFEYSNSFSSPKTVTTQTNTTWRVYSLPIERNKKIEGTILTAYYDPNLQILSDIDQLLVENARQIDTFIEFKNNKLNADKLDSKNIHHSIYFSVIDRFNKVIKEDGAPPTFMDRSYVSNELLVTKSRQIIDKKTGEHFLALSQPILDKNQNTIGIIIIASSLKNINSILKDQRDFLIFSGSLVLIFILILIVYIYSKKIQAIKYISPNKISFDKINSCILLDNYSIPFEYASIQYDLCKTLFVSPGKRWENDELLEKNRMDEDNSQRVFYDASIRINNKIFDKIGTKLIIYKDKTYTINPDLLLKIVKL